MPQPHTATDGTAFDDTKLLFSRSFVEDIRNGRETACSTTIHSSSTICDLALNVKKQMCLLFFRVANVHKLLHSATESIFANFKGTFLEI